MQTGPLMAAWQSAAAGSTRLQALGRHCTLDLCIRIDDEPWFIGIERGCVVTVEPGPFHMRRSDLTISGPMVSWDKFWSAMPPPGFHDLFAMSSYGHVQVQGSANLLREHLAFIKGLLALPRSRGHA